MEQSVGVLGAEATLAYGFLDAGACSVKTRISSCRSSVVSPAPLEIPVDDRKCQVLLWSILPATLGSICKETFHSISLQLI